MGVNERRVEGSEMWCLSFIVCGVKLKMIGSKKQEVGDKIILAKNQFNKIHDLTINR